jgi:hypothetical protein
MTNNKVTVFSGTSKTSNLVDVALSKLRSTDVIFVTMDSDANHINSFILNKLTNYDASYKWLSNNPDLIRGFTPEGIITIKQFKAGSIDIQVNKSIIDGAVKDFTSNDGSAPSVLIIDNVKLINVNEVRWMEDLLDIADKFNLSIYISL